MKEFDKIIAVHIQHHALDVVFNMEAYGTCNIMELEEVAEMCEFP